jgi:conjugative relaxase-like TrwC/TraI family protein
VLTIGKLDEEAIDYYEQIAQAARMSGLHGYYSEADSRLPRVVVVGRDAEKAAAAARDYQGVEAGDVLDAATMQRWFRENVAPSGEQQGRAFTKGSVHGYDLTVAAPKSVSILWALSEDEDVRERVLEAHEAATNAALRYVSEHAGYTRVHNPESGNKDLHKLEALAGARYDHRTSRANDPHLHSHVLIHNRQVRESGGFGSLDGTSLYHEARAAGTVYQATLRAEMAQSLGVEWQPVDPRTGMADLVGIDRETVEAWSQRYTEIDEWTAEYTVEGRERAAATAVGQKATRIAKEHTGRDDAEWLQEWQGDERAGRVDLGKVMGRGRPAGIADEIRPSPESVAALVAQTKSTFTRADVVEAAGALWPSDVDPAEVLTEVESLANKVLENEGVVCVSLNPLHTVGVREDHEREGSIRYTAIESLVQEQTMIREATARREGREVDATQHADMLTDLSADQRRAVENIAGSDRTVTPLVAPAGTGKTWSMRGLRSVYEAEGRTVIGAAPTARAGAVMSEEGAVSSARTVASLVQMIDGGRAEWDQNTVLVLDEAGMVGTPDLARIVSEANRTGAKVVAVGDPSQLAAVETRGGGFELLSLDAADTQTLAQVWRQRDEAEAAATLAVRDGSTDEVEQASEWYSEHDRLAVGNATAMLTDAYEAWAADTAAGRDALLLTGTWEWAHALNERAQHERIERAREQGEIIPEDFADMAGEERARLGDRIITRRNSYSIQAVTEAGTSGGFVRNGDRWTVTDVHGDGGVTVERAGVDETQRAILPAEYVREHARLGYASTIHSAQGATAETCHTVADPDRLDRSGLYVGISRGKDSNRVYLAETRIGEAAHDHGGHTASEARRGTPEEAREAFEGITERDTRDRSVHEVIRAQHRTLYPKEQERAKQLTKAGEVHEERRAAKVERDTEYRADRAAALRTAATEQQARGAGKGAGVER